MGGKKRGSRGRSRGAGAGAGSSPSKKTSIDQQIEGTITPELTSTFESAVEQAQTTTPAKLPQLHFGTKQAVSREHFPDHLETIKSLPGEQSILVPFILLNKTGTTPLAHLMLYFSAPADNGERALLTAAIIPDPSASNSFRTTSALVRTAIQRNLPEFKLSLHAYKVLEGKGKSETEGNNAHPLTRLLNSFFYGPSQNPSLEHMDSIAIRDAAAGGEAALLSGKSAAAAGAGSRAAATQEATEEEEEAALTT